MNTGFTHLWVKSTYSNGDGGGCVEWQPSVARSGVVPVRDSKRVDSPVLTVPAASWAALVDSVR